MKTTVNFYAFRDEFVSAGRKDQFSYDGLEMLFNYCEEVDPDMELDVVALCCEYQESTWQDIAMSYSIDLSECEDDAEKIDAVRDYLTDNTILVGEPLEGVFLFQSF